jgi:hypothetical protein
MASNKGRDPGEDRAPVMTSFGKTLSPENSPAPAVVKQEMDDLFVEAATEAQRPSGPLLNPHLHHPHSAELLARVAATCRGQADWADPSLGKTCRECRSFADKKGERRLDSWGVPKDAWCWEYRRRMKKWGDPIPHTTIACPAFEQNPNPPKARR